MKTLNISVAYNGQTCSCFVQLFDDNGKHFCIVNFSDAALIKEYKGKRIVLSIPFLQEKKDLADIIQAGLLQRMVQ